MKTVSGRITILTDNVIMGRKMGKRDAIAEHGFSAYVETGNGNFLWDTGKGKTVVHNARLFQLDLANMNKIVLSHSHGDHTGGLPEVLRDSRVKPMDVYAHPDVFLHRYRKENGNQTYGGIPFARGYLEKMGARFIFNTDYVEIEDGIFLTGEIPRETTFEGGDMPGRFIIKDGKEIPDIILDDQSMVIHTAKGLVIVLGCAHAGAINIVNHIIKKSGSDKIYAIVGGTHIGFSGEVQLRESITALKSFQIQNLIPSHCTGLEAITEIKKEFEEIFHFSHVGFQLEF